MKYMILLVLLVMLLVSIKARSEDWNSSPNNWNNSPSNWENSQSNWNNSPNNWSNSPNNFGNTRIIRDNNGNAQGYAVPKADGGVNLFNQNGTRKGYMPAR